MSPFHRHVSCFVLATIIHALFPGRCAEAGAARPDFIKATIDREPFSPMPGVPPATPADVLLQGLNGNILEQYSAITLVEIHKSDRDLLKQRGDSNNVGVTLYEHFDKIFILDQVFDARSGSNPLPDGKTADPPYGDGVQGMWLLQFIGPIRTEWHEAVESEGVTLVQYIPYHAFVAAGTPQAIRRAASLRFVQWTMQMHRFLKPVEGAQSVWGYYRARAFLAQTDQTQDAVDLLSSLSIVPVRTAPFTDAELQVTGIFRADRYERILSQPLVWGLSWRYDDSHVANVPATSDLALVIIMGAIMLGALLRLRSG